MKLKIAATAVAFLCLLAAGAAGVQAQQKTPVHITYSENMYAAIAMVAIEKGYLTAQGLEVKHGSAGTAAEVLEAIVGGSTDFGVAASAQIEAIASKKLPIKAVALNSYGFTGSVVVPKKDDKTKTMADLKGKTVGVQFATGTYGIWARYLKTQNLSPKDFNLKNLTNPLIPAAMESNSIDAAVTWEPSTARIVAKGIGRAVLGPNELAGAVNSPYPFFLITSAKMIEQKPEVVQKVINAWGQSIKYIRDNPDDSARIMQESMKKMRGLTLDLNDVKQELYATKYDRLVVNDGDIKDVEEYARVLVEDGKSKAVPDVKPVIDNRFAEKAKIK